jgi:WD40 repeat protein/serine/threonine protein kinase
LLIEEKQLGVEGACAECGRKVLASRDKVSPLAQNGQTDEEIQMGKSIGPDGVAVEWNIGDVILNVYEVTDLLGEGGMGKVYKVLHRGWDMPLAVKSPRARTLLREKGARNFEKECETWVNLGLYPHVVSCYYVRRLGGVPRVFAEFVDGRSMWHCIQDGRMYKGGPRRAVARILDISIQTAWGLQHAHDQGLVHQDVKPANVLIAQDGVAKVTDFGLARAIEAAANGEGGVDFVGMTRGYCSPEQSNREKMTHATDIWSWGICVLECFTVKTVWKRGHEAPDVLTRYLAQSAERPGLLPMPPRLAEVLRRAFQVSPDARPKNMNEIADELVRCYREVAGSDYPRKRPRFTSVSGNNLNNRAMSLLDLGRHEQAEQLWDQALKSDPYHPEATYNAGLFRWRSGRKTDDALLQQLLNVGKLHPGEWMPSYLIAQVHAERGDFRTAARFLGSLPEAERTRREVTSLIGTIRERAQRSCQYVQSIEGHNDAVTCVACSATGKLLVSGSEDNTVKIWDSETTQCVRLFEGHQNTITCVLLTDDERYAVSAAQDRTIRIWDIPRDGCAGVLEGHRDSVQSIAFCAERQRLLSAGLDGALRLWDFGKRVCVDTMEGHRTALEACALSSDGALAVSGGNDRVVMMWDISRCRQIGTMEGHTDAVSALAISPDGGRVLSGSHDRTLRYWNAATGKCLHVLEGHPGPVHAIAFTPDGLHAVSGGRDGALRLWELTSGRCLHTYSGHPSEVNGIAVSGDGHTIVSAGRDRTIATWRIADLEQPYTAPTAMCQAVTSEDVATVGQAFDQALRRARKAREQGDVLGAARYVREARNQAGQNRAPEALHEWRQLYVRLPRGAFRSAWELTRLTGPGDRIKDLRITPSGRYALALSGENTIAIWDLTEQKVVVTFERDAAPIEAVCMTDDGQFALTGGWDLKLWDARRGICVRNFERLSDMVNAVDLSTDGRYAVSAGNKMIRLWDVSSGQCLREIVEHPGDITSIRWLADSRHAIAGGEDRRLRVWDIATGACRGVLEGHTNPITAINVSADGTLAISGSGSLLGRPGEVKLWDMATGACVRAFEGHAGRVSTVQITADNRHVLSGSTDHTIRLWEIGTGRIVFSTEAHPDGVEAAAMSGDGCFIISGGKEGGLRVWTLDWDLEERLAAPWDEGARPCLERFLVGHTPPSVRLPLHRAPTQKELTAALARRGKATWTDADLQRLFYALGCAGYGWLDSAGVMAELEQTAVTWRGPRSIPLSQAQGADQGMMSRFLHRFTGD